MHIFSSFVFVSVDELTRLMDFLELPIDPTRLQCTIEQPEGDFRRVYTTDSSATFPWEAAWTGMMEASLCKVGIIHILTVRKGLWILHFLAVATITRPYILEF